LPASHQWNFWIGALSLGRGGLFGFGFVKPSLLKRKSAAPPALCPGLRWIAKPMKSSCLPPSGQSKARKTRVGERYGRRFTFDGMRSAYATSGLKERPSPFGDAPVRAWMPRNSEDLHAVAQLGDFRPRRLAEVIEEGRVERSDVLSAEIGVYAQLRRLAADGCRLDARLRLGAPAGVERRVREEEQRLVPDQVGGLVERRRDDRVAAGRVEARARDQRT